MGWLIEDTIPFPPDPDTQAKIEELANWLVDHPGQESVAGHGLIAMTQLAYTHYKEIAGDVWNLRLHSVDATIYIFKDPNAPPR